jgi:hypothetical protein
VLSPRANTADVDEIIAVSGGFLSRIQAELYSYKKWMREPAAHAVGTPRTFTPLPESADAVRVVSTLTVLVPKFLLGDSEIGRHFILHSAERLLL